MGLPWTLSDFEGLSRTIYHHPSYALPGPSSTFQTSYSVDHAPYSDHMPSTTSQSLIASDKLPGPTSTGSDGYGSNDSADWPRKDSNHGVLYAAAGVVPVVILAIIGVIVFFYLRKRKRQRAQVADAQARMQEMKTRHHPVVAPHYTSTPPSPPPPAQPQYAAPPSHPPPAASSNSPQPVILGPIGGGSNGAYFTGIDTSDVVSMHDRTGLGNPFADGDSLNEEPPPPYRPRSIALSSRNSSLRAPPSTHSRTNLIANHNQAVRSPFADPEDDTISDISAPPARRNQDTLSVVSDLSYQQEPVVTRPAV